MANEHQQCNVNVVVIVGRQGVDKREVDVDVDGEFSTLSSDICDLYVGWVTRL